MEKIKNFFYSKNDIIIAILILLIALFLIGFRVSKIIAYPSTLMNNVNIKTQAPVSSSPDKDKNKKEADTVSESDKSSSNEADTSTDVESNAQNSDGNTITNE